MQININDLKKVFRKLDIQTVPCSHHVRGFLIVNGKKVLALHFSNGRNDMPGSVPHLFRRSLHLSQDEFLDLVRCPLSRDAYLALLQERGILDRTTIEG